MSKIGQSDGGHAGGHAMLEEQFDSMRQQRETGVLGMWTFLATEVLLFGGLFTCYGAYRFTYPEAFHAASGHLYMILGTVNTLILLGSSWMVALAVHAAERGEAREIIRWLLVAIGLGTVFLVIKGMEYALEYHEHLVPWLDFQFEEAHEKPAKMFFVSYFFMTGAHALHMIIGLSVLGVIAWKAHRGRYSVEYHVPVEIAGLYWHFVDIVWIFLFPALYLINPKWP